MVSRLRVFITVLSMLALASQSVAAVAVNCSMMDPENSSAVEMEADGHLDHMNHQTMNPANIQDYSTGCCGESLCDMPQCASPSLFSLVAETPVFSSLPRILNSEYLFAYSGIKQLSIFRPPISH